MNTDCPTVLIRTKFVARISSLAIAAAVTVLQPAFASTLTANVVDFSIESVGSSGSITGINSTNGIENYLEIQIPALSSFALDLGGSNGAQLQYLDSFGNSGAFVPTGSGYSYSNTTSAVGTGGSSPIQDAGSAKIYDSSMNLIGQITPGYLHSSAQFLAGNAGGLATFTNDQTGGPAVLQIDWIGMHSSNMVAPITATFSVSAVPLPTSAWLLLSGLAGIGMIGRSRVRSLAPGGGRSRKSACGHTALRV